MDISLIFKITAIGIIIAILNTILSKAGKDEYTMITTITGIIRNPLYKGTAVMNKVHYDFNIKKLDINSYDLNSDKLFETLEKL